MKKDSFHMFFSRICLLSWKTLSRTPLSGCFWCLHTAILIQNSEWKRYLTVLLESIFCLLIFLIRYKIEQDRLSFEHFEWQLLVKISKLYMWNLTGKNKHKLVADLAYIIVHHLKSIYQTLVPKWHQTGYLQKLIL